MRSRPQIHLLLLACLPAGAACGADWLQFGYDQAHSGNNTAETTLSAANVGSLVAAYASPASLPATADNAPVFLSGVSVGNTTRDLLFVVAKTGELVALDAASGTTVWHSTPTGLAQITTSTPAIDPGHQYVYAYDLDGKVHKYQVGDGTEIKSGGWPETVTLKPSVEKGAAGLSIAQVASGATYLYAVTNGYIGDGGDYQGHIVTIDLASGVQTVFNGQCSNLPIHFVADQGKVGIEDCPQVFSPFPGSSGIWGRPGAVYDSGTDRVFIATANGLFDARDTVFRDELEPMTSGFNFGDSVLALAADGSARGQMPLDSYTPANYAALQGSDLDLGSASPAILPAPEQSKYPHLALQGGKDAKLRLLDLDDLSGHGAPGFVSCTPAGPQCITSELQILNVPQGGQVKPQPAVWVDGQDATWVFVATGNGISALKMSVDGSGNPTLSSQWSPNKSGNSTSPVVANGVLYVANGTHVLALDPATGTTLWTSPTISGGFHWQSLIVVNGHIYLPDNNAHLWAFGLP